MEEKSICRCCLSEGPNKDLDLSYNWMDKKEVYSSMLRECFDIILSKTLVPSGICDPCIDLLRGSLEFKNRIKKSEREILKKLNDGLDNENDQKVEIKVEVKSDSDCSETLVLYDCGGDCAHRDEAGEDSDDYFLSDAVTKRKIDVDLDAVKSEPTPKIPTPKTPTPKIPTRSVKKEAKKQTKPACNPKSKTKAAGDRADKIRKFVSRLASSMNDDYSPKLRDNKKKMISVGQQRLKVGGDITVSRKMTKKNIEIIWKSDRSAEKDKHKANLQVILEFSNAVPFKNKSLLGYICGYCDAAYPDPSDLRSHTQNAHKKDRLKYSTDCAVKLDVTDLTCALCEEQIDNLNILKEHLVKSHAKVVHTDIKDCLIQYKLKKGEVYDCSLCSSTYETFKMLKQHMNKHYTNYVCDKCDTAFATKRSLYAHSTTHIEGNFKCAYCDKVFANKPKRQFHEKMSHFGMRNISNCAFCDEPFRSYYQRNQHMIKVHNSEAQYKCNTCDKVYILKSLLMSHIKKNHLMEKNYQCTECGYRFFSRKALKAHMIKHTGERIHSCGVCNKSYARKYTLREHMRIHNNDRRFRCTVCELSFVQKCSLKSHLLSNHGISMTASEITSVPNA